MAKKLFKDDQPPVDFDTDVLTQEEIAAVELEASEEVAADAKDMARKSLKAKLVAKAKKSKGLTERDAEVTIDLAPYCDRILIDNTAYLQGKTYTLPLSRAQVLRETMQRTWTHQAEIDGKSENFYRRTRAQRVVPAGNGAAVVTAGSLLRA